MSDLSKAPEGATHYGKDPVRYFKYSNDKKDMYYFTGDWFVKLAHWPRHGTVFKIPDWNIYNNTKPLCELTEEQRGLLFNHWCNGGETQIFNGDGWGDVLDSCNLINRNYPYRAKIKKSERELFIEAAMAAASLRGKEGAKKVYGELFDAGFKAPLQTKEGDNE